jgi:hypothetical protein
MNNRNESNEEYLYDEKYNEEDYINEGFGDNLESINQPTQEQHETEYENPEEYDYEEQERETEPIYEMTLEIEGQSKTIRVFSDSNPEELAYEFCRENNLDINALRYLAGELTNLIQKYKVKGDDNRLHDEIVEVDEENNITDKNRNDSEGSQVDPQIHYDHNNTSEEGNVHQETVQIVSDPNQEYEEETRYKKVSHPTIQNITSRNVDTENEEINPDEYGRFFAAGQLDSRNQGMNDFSKKENTETNEMKYSVEIKDEPISSNEFDDNSYKEKIKPYEINRHDDIQNMPYTGCRFEAEKHKEQSNPCIKGNVVQSEHNFNKEDLKRYLEIRDNGDKYSHKKHILKSKPEKVVTNVIKEDYRSLNYNYLEGDTKRDYIVPQPNLNVEDSNSNRANNKYKRNYLKPKETLRTHTEELITHIEPMRRQSFDYKESESKFQPKQYEEKKHEIELLPSNFLTKSLNNNILPYDSPNRCLSGRDGAKLFINELINEKPNLTNSKQTSFISTKVFSSKQINVNHKKRSIFEKLYNDASTKRLNTKKLIKEINKSTINPLETSQTKPKNISITPVYHR